MSAPDLRVADVLIRDLVEGFPEPRPAAEVVASVVAEGNRQRRRRRRAGALGGLVVAALMVLAALALGHAAPTGPTGPTAPVATRPGAATTPQPPAGTVWLQHDRAALAVPVAWREDIGCGDLGVRVTDRDRRGKGLDPARCFAGASGDGSWVRFGSFDTAVGVALARTVPASPSSADGKAADSLTVAPRCGPGGCTGVVVLSQSSQFALVHGATRVAVERITGSLTFLPPPGSADPGGS